MFCVPVRLEPSNDCGPFKTQDHVYKILTSRVGDLPMWLRDVIVYASTPAIVVPIILLLLYVSTPLCADFTCLFRSLSCTLCIPFSPFCISGTCSSFFPFYNNNNHNNHINNNNHGNLQEPSPRFKALNKDNTHRVNLDRECCPQFNQN